MIDQDFLEVQNNQNDHFDWWRGIKKRINDNMKISKIIGAVVLIIILLIGGFYVFKNKVWKIGQEKQQEIKLKNVVTPQITKIPEDKLQKEMPVGFPKEIPLNGKTKVIESYDAAYAQNQNIKQATINFESSKSIKENYDFYSKWAKDNKWEIKDSKQENPMSLYGQKNQTILNITIIPKTSPNTKSEVNITYGEF